MPEHTIGDRIQKCLLSEGMTAKELAEKTGANVATLSRVIHGKQTCGKGLLYKISIALNVPYEYLRGKEEHTTDDFGNYSNIIYMLSTLDNEGFRTVMSSLGEEYERCNKVS